MKCDILRTPGTDLIHDFAAKGITEPVEVPPDLKEGDVADLPDNVAEALIKVGVAKPVETGKDKDKGAKSAAAHKDEHPPAAPHKGTQHPPAK